jgi:putative restriction endonuclease
VSPRIAHAEQEILEVIPRIKTWKKGSQRAPHKPLLLLLALGRVQRGEPRLVRFSQVEKKLRELLVDYGPPRGSHQPELPFWHLQSDGLWEVPRGNELEKRKGKKLPLIAEMRTAARGGFTGDVDAALREDPELIRRVARVLLDEHFPTSYHEDLLTSVGLELSGSAVKRARRDPDFRDQVLNAYGYQCAVCGLAPLLDGTHAALEAAHIRWHSHGGPSTVENGLCLCPLHHKGLDLGVLGIGSDRRIMISSRLHGGEATEASFGQYHEKMLRGPFHGQPPVQAAYLKWHARQVFKNPPRK